jgi:ribokinase
VSGRRRQGGGNTSCALAAAARLGSRCALLGRLGEGELSRFVRDHLSSTGVDLSRILCDRESGPIYCMIVVAADTGSRAIFIDRSLIKPLLPAELRPEWFADAKVLLVDNLHPPTILPAVRMAREQGLQVVSDIETRVPELDAIRAQIDHFICSAEFAVPYTGAQGPSEACRVLAQSGRHRTVAVTAGAAGCYWCNDGQPNVIHTPPHSVDPVDTTGCGDVFHGAFCHGLAQGWPIERVIPFANAAGAIKATRTGGWAAVPTPEEVQRMLAAATE